MLGDKLLPSGEDGSLPWEELRRCAAVYFVSGDVAALRAARRCPVLVATARELDDAAQGRRRGRRARRERGGRGRAVRVRRARAGAEDRRHDCRRARRLDPPRRAVPRGARCPDRSPTLTAAATASPRGSPTGSRWGSRSTRPSHWARNAEPPFSPAGVRTATSSRRPTCPATRTRSSAWTAIGSAHEPGRCTLNSSRRCCRCRPTPTGWDTTGWARSKRCRSSRGSRNAICERIAKLARIRRFAPGSVMVRTGDAGRSFYVLLDGSAKVTRAGRRSLRLEAGDFLRRDGPHRRLSALGRRRRRRGSARADDRPIGFAKLLRSRAGARPGTAAHAGGPPPGRRGNASKSPFPRSRPVSARSYCYGLVGESGL